MTDFKKVVDKSRLVGPIPSEIANTTTLDIVCDDLRKAFNSDRSWGINYKKFDLDGGDIVNAIAKKAKGTMSWLIGFIYHHVLAAKLAS
jgi:hypothetical protein